MMDHHGPIMYDHHHHHHHHQHYHAMSLAESSSSSSSSSNIILSVLASTQPASPGPMPSDGVLAMMMTSSSSSTNSSTTPSPPQPPRHGLSIKGFASREEYLQAMLEDISYWLYELVFCSNNSNSDETVCTADNFFNVIETGEVLCELANRICERIIRDNNSAELPDAIASRFASFQPLSFRRRVKPESFFARDNISTFLNWVSSTWQIHQCLMFESDDLVLRKSEKNVVLCLLEVARKAYASGLKVAPMLVQMEADIDKELSGSGSVSQPHGAAVGLNIRLGLVPDQPTSFQQISFNNLVSLDELVRDQLGRCSCPVQFPMIKVADGKYRIGNSNVLIFVRVLRSHVMVRVGGGWDTLEAYLNRHDPCRCNTVASHPSSAVSAAATSSYLYYHQHQQAMSQSAHQTSPHIMTTTDAVASTNDFMMSASLIDSSALNPKTSSLMPPTPPLSDGNSHSGGETSPAMGRSPSTLRNRSTSRQRASSARRAEVNPEPHPQPPALNHLTEAGTLLTNSRNKFSPLSSKRQKSAPVPSTAAPEQRTRRKKLPPSSAQSLSSTRIRSAPTSRSAERGSIMINRTAQGKHEVDVGLDLSRRQCTSPIMKEDRHSRHQAKIANILAKARSRLTPRKDPLAGMFPSRIPLPSFSIVPSSTKVVEQNQNSLPLTAPEKPQHDDQTFACVRATMVMTICEEEDELVMKPRRDRRDTGLGSSSASTLLNTPPDTNHDDQLQNSASCCFTSGVVDEDDLLNEFVAMEKLVENEMSSVTLAASP